MSQSSSPAEPDDGPDFYDDFFRLVGPIIRGSKDGAIAGWGALANVQWRHQTEPDIEASWGGPTFRSAAEEIADIRADGSGYMDWYCSGPDGTVRDDIAQIMASAGWVWRLYPR